MNNSTYDLVLVEELKVIHIIDLMECLAILNAQFVVEWLLLGTGINNFTI